MKQAVDDILSFWLGLLDEEGLAEPEKQRQWWLSNPAFDQEINSQFAAVLHTAENGMLLDWLSSAYSCLAYIILTDQFSRNIYRHTEKAFSNDDRAQAATRHVLKNNYLKRLAVTGRCFCIMPLMHSERLEDHQTLEQLLNQQVNEVGLSNKGVRFWSGIINSAQEHRSIIECFGRYPHRNEVLQRQSTVRELEYLQQNSRRFGQ
ncbi:DUF924 family protein [Gynuella sunshinyii]|uniref:DUF924 domain-containing protein n=1 Tax=Gynuella sunshinyii YC6258 TaxID=1445510 RepID=A0A0C5VP94_9GAMM|nr:DUF924 family protein [Gynuella sunshinyii]AJQ96477.1 hypothetical protein YC6258_04445 [Gynuella sunshinyii YC6258]